jgi:hypothetical protein
MMRLTLCLRNLIFRFSINLAQDYNELLDVSGRLPSDFAGQLPEFFAESEFNECWMGFSTSDCSDKKRCSSGVIPQSLFAIFERNSPSSTGIPSSSPNSFPNVIGLCGGCSLREAHIVSA